MRRNRVLYVCLLFLSSIFIYFYGGKIPYMLFYTTLITPVVSIILTIVIFLRFKYTQEIDKKFIMKGDKVNFLFSIANEDVFFYPYMKVNFCGSESIFSRQFESVNLSLAPHGHKSLAFELECKYRGCYDIGIQSVELLDILGIFKLTYRFNEAKYITVYPKIVPLERFHIRTNFLSETHSMLKSNSEDTALISDIRKYMYGDSYKKIHWKLTAKMNDIMVKNFESTSQTNAVLFIDLKRNIYLPDQNILIEDKLIESVVSIAHYCLSNWIPINLVYYSTQMVNIEAKSPPDFDEVYNALSKVRFLENVGIGDVVKVYLENKIALSIHQQDNFNRTNIIIFTSNIDRTLFNQLCSTRESGYGVTLVYTSPKYAADVEIEDEDNILSTLPDSGVDVYKLDVMDDVKLVLER